MTTALRVVASVALAALATTALCAEGPVGLRVPPPFTSDLARMPLIEAPTDDAERRINAALPRLDARVRRAAARCRMDGHGRYHWSRTVEATMRGPKFLSFIIADDASCGGAHPNASTSAIVYDLTTVKPVDWTQLLPPALTGKVSLVTAMDGTKMVALSSKRLFELYMKGYRPPSVARKPEDDGCREAVTSAGVERPPDMAVWLDAKNGGMALQFDLAHAVQACADAVIVPAGTLKAEGASPVLLEALTAASASPK